MRPCFWVLFAQERDVVCELFVVLDFGAFVERIQNQFGIGVFALRDIPKGAYPLKSMVSNKEIKFSRVELKSVPSTVLYVAVAAHRHDPAPAP